MTHRQAADVLLYWAMSPDDEVRKEIASVLNVPPEDFLFLSRHPSCTLGVGDVLSVWKQQIENVGPIHIITTARTDPKVLSFADGLSEPAVEITDGTALIRKIRRAGFRPAGMKERKRSVKRLFVLLTELPRRRRWSKSAQTGLLLVSVYFLSGRNIYLFLGAASLFLAGMSFRLQRSSI